MKHYVLLSGGLDSTTTLACIKAYMSKSDTIHAVSVYYGQRHDKELLAATKIAEYYGCSSWEILDLHKLIPKTLLTSTDEIPRVSYADLGYGLSPTFVPFRNGLMLSALTSLVFGNLAKNETATIYFGAHLDDAANSAYPDCSREFVEALGLAIKIGTYNKISLVAPWIDSKKEDIVKWGSEHNVPFKLTWSCYVGGEKHCGTCMTCRSRKEAFVNSGVSDPTEYEI